jgi:hypothetical protein
MAEPDPSATRYAIGDAPVPRPRRRRALLCSSTPPQFVEMLRVARFLEKGDEFQPVLWMQMLPHKLAEGVAICEREGFHYMAHPLGAAAVFGTKRPIPFARETWHAAKARPLDPRGWWRVVSAVAGRVWLRSSRYVLVTWVNFCRSQAALTQKISAAVYGAARVAGQASVRMARAIARLTGFRWHGLPRPLRPLAIYAFMALFLIVDRVRLINTTSLLAGYRARNRSAGADLEKLRPDLIVIAEDSLYDYASFIAEGWWRGIPTVVVPYTISTAAEPAETILGSPELHTDYALETWPARLVARLFPEWVYVYNGHTLLRLPPELVLVLEHLRLAPPRPWLFNSGYSVALAAESEHMADLYLREGLDPEYVVLTGALYDDSAAAVAARRAEKRRQLLQEAGLPARRTVVVCALPPRMEIDRRAGCEFATHEEIVEFMLAPLAALPDTSVVVSLHPTLKIADMRYVEGGSVRISTWDVADLIACADLFVASISATIRMAIASGVPVVNFDVFRYGYRDYEEAPGVVTMATRSAYTETMRRIRSDPAYLEGLRAGQGRVAARWGFRDGRSGQAVLELFKHVIAHKSPRGYRSPHGRART